MVAKEHRTSLPDIQKFGCCNIEPIYHHIIVLCYDAVVKYALYTFL